MIEAHAYGVAILLPDGTVLLVGGIAAGNAPEIAGAELYAPGNGN